jgi:hypothetical protein
MEATPSLPDQSVIDRGEIHILCMWEEDEEVERLVFYTNLACYSGCDLRYGLRKPEVDFRVGAN